MAHKKFSKKPDCTECRTYLPSLRIIRNHLAVERCVTDTNIKQAVTSKLQKPSTVIFYTLMLAVVSRCDKYVPFVTHALCGRPSMSEVLVFIRIILDTSMYGTEIRGINKLLTSFIPFFANWVHRPVRKVKCLQKLREYSDI